MKNKLPTVTIGVPAYNEALNIANLLKSLISQEFNNFVVDKIIVSSDGSTDATVAIAKKFNSNLVRVINNKKRNGLAKNSNIILNKSSSDILILINADMAINDSKFLTKFVKEMISNNGDLVAANLIPIKPRGIFERALYFGTVYTKRVFDNFENGDNWATCHGAARAFSKRFYSTFRFKKSVGEDMYSYFYCRFNKYNYIFAKNVKLFYKLPDNLEDHKKRSLRYLNSRLIVEKEFGKDFISKNFCWPIKKLVQEGIALFFIDPIGMAFYVIITLYMTFTYKFEGKDFLEDKWQMSSSTRVVNI